MTAISSATNYSLQNQNTVKMMDATPYYKTSFWIQWYLLTIRLIRCYSRDRVLGIMRLAVHFFIALVMGILYRNVGNNAAQTSFNYRFIFLTLIFFMHTSFCSMTILCKF